MRKSLVAALLSLGLTPGLAFAQSEPLPPLPPPADAPPSQAPRAPGPNAPDAPLPPPPPPYPPPPYPPPSSPPPYSRGRVIIVHGCGEPTGPYCHDGFYMRLGLGLAYTSVWGTGPSGNASISGTGVALSASFGGTVARGLVIGGALRIADGLGPFTGAPPDAPGNATASLGQLLGVFVDWYPAPTDGWHVGSQVGLGITSVTDSLSRESSGPALAGSVFGGYDWWIGPQWSLGLLMSLSTATTATMVDSTHNDTGYSFRPLAFGVEASILWH